MLSFENRRKCTLYFLNINYLCDMKKLIRENIYYFSTFLLFVVAGTALLFTVGKENVTLWVNSHYSSVLDSFFLMMTELGSLWFSLVIVLILFIWKKWRVAVNACICLGISSLVTLFVKFVLFPGSLRPVPYFKSREISLRLINGVEQLQTESFPSGHTTEAFAIATFLALFLSKKEWHPILAIIAILVGYSRIYLSQHFITDVYMGMIIGTVTTTLTYWFSPLSGERQQTQFTFHKRTK